MILFKGGIKGGVMEVATYILNENNKIKLFCYQLAIALFKNNKQHPLSYKLYIRSVPAL